MNVKDKLRALWELSATQKAVGLLLVLLAGTSITVAVVDDDGDGPNPPRPTITIKLPGGGTVQADRDQQLEPAEQREAAVDTTPSTQSPAPDAHEDLVDEQPAGAPAGAADKVLDANPDPPLQPRPPAGAQNLSCPQKLVRNRSARSGRVSMFVLHYTVSRPGSLDAIWGLFNTPSFGASSTYLLEPSGRCRLIVPFSQKPWTQGAFNSVSESVEIMAMGNESRAWWLSQPIFTRGLLAEMVRDRLRARGLPLRRVDPVGCTPRAGWTDHNALECGNDHHDVQPSFPYDVLQKQIVRGVVSRAQLRRDCAWVHGYRKRRAADRSGTRAGRRSFERRLKRVRRAGRKCVAGKAVKR